MNKILLLIYVLGGIFLFSSCSKENEKNKLIVFNAGSLSLPLQEIAAKFEKENPNTHVVLEAGGSLACARKITDLHSHCDVFLSADYKVVDKILIPKYASWDIKFATNEIVIAYNKSSKYRKKINSTNWYKLLLEPGVTIGYSNPNNDPCGYQTLFMLQLASLYYGEKNLYHDMITESKGHSVEIRPKETDLIALLQTDTIDYLFIYLSIAKQCGFDYLELPPEINLGDRKYADYYKQAQVTISGSKPDTSTIVKGEPMAYSLTILKDAKNPELALKFVKFILDKNKGIKIFESNGQASLIPSPTSSYDMIPDVLKKYAEK